MTYSAFFGRKQFICLYSKKKFKKHLIMSTMLSMFLSELLIIVCDVVGITTLPFGEQLLYTLLDSCMLTVVMMFLQFYEISKLDKPNTYMITVNTSGHQGKKSLAANESSDEEGLMSTSDESDDEDWPDWRLMLKHVEGNTELFKKTQFQLKLNELELRMDLRKAESLCDFDTRGEADQRDGRREDDAPRLEDKKPAYWDDDENFGYLEDPRGTRSHPASPRFLKEFDGTDFEHFGNRFDNCYAESQAPRVRGDGKEYSEMGTQAQPSEILTALARKGGDLVTPGVDKDDYSKRKSQKKKRGRKNKYYRQIDAEDDEEADQMSEGSEEDGLDGIKEEDEEDEEERLAKLAALKRQQELEEQERLRAAEEARKKKEAADKAAADAKSRADAEAQWLLTLQQQVAIDDLARKANSGD